MISSPGPASEPSAIWFAMVPLGAQSAASLPSRSATRSCRRLTVGSSPYTSSPTSAVAMAARIGSVGRVTVSLRRSMIIGYSPAVGRESKAARASRAREIVARLDKAMPEAKIALEYGDELQLLVSVMLSAQSTDKLVNTVTPALFARFPTAQAYARSSPAELERYIQRVGLYRGKAR